MTLLWRLCGGGQSEALTPLIINQRGGKMSYASILFALVWLAMIGNYGGSMAVARGNRAPFSMASGGSPGVLSRESRAKTG
jgi:hypothetical protein